MASTTGKWSASLQHIKQDALASVVVFLIALPFSMGVALASGAPIGAGLIPGAVAAIIAGIFGGAPFVVTGPAASVAVLVFEIGEKHGLAAVGAATLAAGLLQLALGSLRIARLAASLPAPVVHGMLASVGLLMAAGQVAVLFGGQPAKDFLTNVLSFHQHVTTGNPWAALAGGTALVVLISWPYLRIKAVPASLVGIALATLVTAVFHLDVPKIDLPEQTWQLAWPAVPFERLGEWLGAAMAIGLIASTESLLSAVAVDKLHTGPRAALNRELVGQGFANVVSGLLGGLPVTGGSVRSTANLEAKAKTRASTVMHGVWLVVAATFLDDVLENVPLSALAALLIMVSVKLVNPKAIRGFVADGSWPAYFATAAMVLVKGLLWGIGVGLAVSFVLNAWRRARVAQVHRQLAASAVAQVPAPETPPAN